MRVLHLVSVATMTGPADPALGLAKAQRELLGLDARIAFDTIREGDMRKRCRQLEVPMVEALSLCTKGGLGRALADRKALAELMRDLDLVHAHASHDHGVAVLARHQSPKVRLVRSIHHGRSAHRRLFQGFAYRRTDGFTVVAEAHRKALLSSYEFIDPDRVRVVPGAVDPDRFTPERRGEELRRQLGIPKSAFVVGMIARFQPGRGQPRLIDAIARIRRDRSLDLWLALIGKGETQREIEAAIERAGLGDRTRLYGFRDADLPEAIRSCDVTVLLKEGSDAGCRAVLESLACGVPVVGARFPAIIDALDEERCGRLIPPDDAPAIAAAIVEMASLSEESRRDLGAAGRRRVLGHYTPRHRADRVQSLYERC